MKPKIEFHYVSKCPRVNEMAKNIEDAIAKIDFDIEYIEKIMNEDNELVEGYGCPSLLVDGYDLIGRVKCDQKQPFCRIYPNGIPSAEEIRKFIICSY